MNNKKELPSSSWYKSQEEWDKKTGDDDIIETNVVLRLSENFDIAAEVISAKLGYKSLNEYVSNVIKENIISQLEGAMDLEVEQIEEVEREMASISRQREIDSWK